MGELTKKERDYCLDFLMIKQAVETIRRKEYTFDEHISNENNGMNNHREAPTKDK